MSFNVFTVLALALDASHGPQQPQAGAICQHSGPAGRAPSVTRASLPLLQRESQGAHQGGSMLQTR